MNDVVISRKSSPTSISPVEPIKTSSSKDRKAPLYFSAPSQKKKEKASDLDEPKLIDPDQYHSEIGLGVYAEKMVEIIESLEDCMKVLVGDISKNFHMTQKILAQSTAKQVDNQIKIDQTKVESSKLDFAKRLLICVLGAASIIAGGFAIAAGASVVSYLTGAGLVAAGTLNIVAFTLKEFGVLGTSADALNIVASSIGFMSGGNLLLSGNTMSETVMRLVFAAIGIAAASVGIGQATFERKMQQQLQEKAEADGNMQVLQNNIKAMAKMMKIAIDNTAKEMENLPHFVQLHTDVMKRISGSLRA